MAILSNAWDETSVSDMFIPDEASRWKKLLESSFEFSEDPLRYGPLTVEGYLSARESYAIPKSSWPRETASISNLLMHCNITPDQVAAAAASHLQYFDVERDDEAFARILLIQVDLMGRLGTPLQVKDLTDVLSSLKWRDAFVRMYTHVFKLTPRYLHSAEDETTFLKQWLPKVHASPTNFGEHSLGVEIARHFTRADPKPIAKWCNEHADAQGLAFLVWQRRVPFRDWLREVAKPTNSQSRIHYDDEGGYERDWWTEQLRCLDLLMSRFPIDDLVTETKGLLENFPLAKRVMAQVRYQPCASASIAWVVGMLKVGAVTKNDPELHAWIKAATSAQKEILSRMEWTSSSWKEHTSFAEYAKWGPLADLGGEALSFLAEHLALHLHIPSTPRPMAELEWLRQANIGETLLALAVQAKVTVTQKMAVLLPYLSPEDKVKVGLKIVMASGNGDLNLSKVLCLWRDTNPAYFQHATIDFSDDRMTLLRAIAQHDTTDLSATLSVLDIDATNAAYEHTIECWMQQVMGVSDGMEYTPLPEMLAGIV